MLRLLGILALGYVLFGGRHCHCHHRHGSFLGGLFVLPLLLCGGWIAIAFLAGTVGMLGSIVGGILSGLAEIASDLLTFSFSWKSVVLGALIGLAGYYLIRRRNAAESEEE